MVEGSLGLVCHGESTPGIRAYLHHSRAEPSRYHTRYNADKHNREEHGLWRQDLCSKPAPEPSVPPFLTYFLGLQVIKDDTQNSPKHLKPWMAYITLLQPAPQEPEFEEEATHS